jgi:hypothetical protein
VLPLCLLRGRNTLQKGPNPPILRRIKRFVKTVTQFKSSPVSLKLFLFLQLLQEDMSYLRACFGLILMLVRMLLSVRQTQVTAAKRAAR